MAGYPHDMGPAVEVWCKTIPFPGCGEIIVLASYEVAHLDPDKKDRERFIGQITASVRSDKDGGWSGYLFNHWYDTKKEAISELMRLLYLSGRMSLQTVDFKLL